MGEGPEFQSQARETKGHLSQGSCCQKAKSQSAAYAETKEVQEKPSRPKTEGQTSSTGTQTTEARTVSTGTSTKEKEGEKLEGIYHPQNFPETKRRRSLPGDDEEIHSLLYEIDCLYGDEKVVTLSHLATISNKLNFTRLYQTLSDKLNLYIKDLSSDSLKLLIENNIFDLDLDNTYSENYKCLLDTNSKTHVEILNQKCENVSTIKTPNLSYLGKRVVNLSRFKLGRSHTSVLEKGITFCPTPGKVDLAEVHQDVSKFFRRLKLKLFFHDEENPSGNSFSDNVPSGLLKFKKKSTWTPGSYDHCLNAFIEKVNNDLVDIDSDIPVTQNLSLEERKALSELKGNNDIVIKKADKGSSIVVMNIEDYVKEAERQLSDEKFYKKVNNDLSASHNEIINNLLDNLKSQEAISEEVYNCLYTNNPKTASLYLLPKIHKIKACNEFPPGRPIISANGCPTEKISAFVDENIKGSIPKIKSYVKDTTDFIRKIESLKIPENCILVTFDVTSLYTNIPNKEGIEAVRNFLRLHTPKYASTNTVVTLLHEVLTKNNFEFNGKNYLQVGGTAMGTKLAPSYANIFMGELEEKTLQASEHKPLLWVRFIDDIFVVWPHSEQKLHSFHEHLNSFHENIQYTMEFSKEKIVFLDTWVKVLRNTLIVELYTKPTDTHNYLHFTSSHPKHTKRGGPYGQFLRVRRNCTLESDYVKHSDQLKKHYLDRGYPESLIDNSREKALMRNRRELLTPKKSHQESDNVVPLVLTHHPSNYLVRKIITDNWGILKFSDRCKSALPDAPLFATRRSPNIRDILVHSKLNKGESSGINHKVKPAKCHKPYCRVCKRLKDKDAHCTNTGKTHICPKDIDCHTKNVVYLLTCSICKK